MSTVQTREELRELCQQVYSELRDGSLVRAVTKLWAFRAEIADSDFAMLPLKTRTDAVDIAPFAFRIVGDIRRYVAEAQSIGGTWHDAFDEQLVQKILPKLAKSDERIGDALERCVEIAREDDLVLTSTKVTTMLDGFNRYGFASYF